MEKFLSNWKDFFVKSMQHAHETIKNALLKSIQCFRQCHSRINQRRHRQIHNRQLQQSALNSDRNDVKITFGQDGPPYPSAEVNNFSTNTSTTTDETASDDSLLGSPNVAIRSSNDWTLAQMELTLRSRPGENDDGSCTCQIGEVTSDDTSVQSPSSPSSTLRICPSCADKQSSALDLCGYEKLRKMNESLQSQVHASNERIMALEKKLLELQSESTHEAMVTDDANADDCEKQTTTDCITETGGVSTSCALQRENVQMNYSVARPPPPAPLPPPNWDFSLHSMQKRRKRVPKPTCPLKTLNWIKLNEQSLQGTVWTDLEDESMYTLMDLKEIDNHFACASDPFGTIRSRASVCSAIREISVLDARRAQNCAILLSKLKLSDEEIKRAIVTLDTSDCIPKDMAEQLLKFIPTKEEIELLSPYQHSKDILHPADRYFIEISGIKRCEQRLQCLCFKKVFMENVDEMTKRIDTVMQASRRVLASRRFKKVLAVILALGNYLNHSKRSSDACAFHLSALTSLQDVKSSVNNEYTLMHYLVDLFGKCMPDLFGLLQETAICIEAAKISGSDLRNELDALKEGLQLLDAEIKSSQVDRIEGADKFLVVAMPLLEKYSVTYSSLESSFKQMKSAFTVCCKAYAPEDNYEETLNVSEFFSYFAQFLNQFTLVETQITRKRHEEEIRSLTLTRVRARRRANNGANQWWKSSFNQKVRRSSRMSKRVVPEMNEELLTSVLLAMDNCQDRRAGMADVILYGPPRQRRSARLSARRKQSKSTSTSSNSSIIRRRTSTKSKSKISVEKSNPTSREENVKMQETGHHPPETDADLETRRDRKRHCENLCRDR